MPVIGTLLGVGVGVLLNSGSEHRKWLRSERYQSYMTVVDAMRAHNPRTADEEQRESGIHALMHACRRAELVAPKTVRYAMIRLMADGVVDRTGQAYSRSREDVLNEMRKNLRISQVTLNETVQYYRWSLRRRLTRGESDENPSTENV